MEEIKFRAWDGKIMHENVVIIDNKAYKRGYFATMNVNSEAGIPMQYIGLHDKNGKGIFEGDIVKFGQYKYQIIYEIGGFGLLDVEGLMISKIGGINDHVYSLQVLYLECCWEESSAFDLEVIRNIYDNPELIRRGKL